MRSTSSFSWKLLVASSALLCAIVFPVVARALPQCAPASPATVGVAKLYAYNSWQKYRTLPPEHRCCAKPCEPLGSFAGKIEVNADALNAVARNPKVSEAERKRALANFNALSKQRNDTTFQFLQCIAQSAPVGTGASARCGKILVTDSTLAWAAWCGAYSDRLKQFRDLLLAHVGNSVGSWRVQSNYFRINREGGVDDDSVAMLAPPATTLPAGTSPLIFKNFITNDANGYPPTPSANRTYMRFTASAYRPPGPAGTKPLDTSVLIDGVCPGPVNRP